MRIRINRVTLVSAAASMVGVALVVHAVFVLLDGHWDKALSDAGLGLYCCVWAFVPYDEFLRVAGMPLRSRERGRPLGQICWSNTCRR